MRRDTAHFVHVGREPVSPAWRCQNIALAALAAGKGASQQVDCLAEIAFLDDPATPDRRQQLVLLHHPAGVLHEKEQRIELGGRQFYHLAI